MPSRVFIKSSDCPDSDWQELTGTMVSNSITVSEYEPDPFLPTTLNFTATVHVSRKDSIRMCQAFGAIKRPHLTYKTHKRNCAKRNRT